MKLNMMRTFEPMHDGKILKLSSECRELKSQTDGYYYYDSDKKEIASLTLTNNGNISIGNIKEEEGRLLLYWDVVFPDRKIKL